GGGGHCWPVGGDRAKRKAWASVRSTLVRANRSAGHCSTASVIGASAAARQTEATVCPVVRVALGGSDRSALIAVRSGARTAGPRGPRVEDAHKQPALHTVDATRDGGVRPRSAGEHPTRRRERQTGHLLPTPPAANYRLCPRHEASFSRSGLL